MRGILTFVSWVIVIFILFFEAWINFKWFGVIGASVIIFGIFYYVNRAQLMFMGASAKFNTGDKKSAFEKYEKAYKTGKLKPTNALFYAYLLLRDGQIEKSENLIDEIYTKYNKILLPNDKINVSINKALIKWKKGDVKGAIADAKSLYDSGIKTTALYGIMGYWYILDEKYDEALKINEEAYEYNESDQIICDNLAQNYFLTGNKEKSEEMYKELLSKEPNFIEPYYNYGMILKSNGNFEGAKEYFKKALTMEEKFLSTVTHNMVNSELSKLC